MPSKQNFQILQYKAVFSILARQFGDKYRIRLASKYIEDSNFALQIRKLAAL